MVNISLIILNDAVLVMCTFCFTVDQFLYFVLFIVYFFLHQVMLILPENKHINDFTSSFYSIVRANNFKSL